MKNLPRYIINDTWKIVASGNYFHSPAWVFYDKKPPKKSELEKLFYGSYKTFRLRVRDLGKLDIKTSANDADALRVVMNGLIHAKNQIQKEQGT